MTRLRASTLVPLFVLCACATVAQGPVASPGEAVVDTKHPRILSVDPTKENQLRDGVRIIVTPTPFRMERETTSEFRFQTAALMVNGGPGRRRDRSVPGFSPGGLRFKIRISNRLPQVVRLAGTAIAFQLAGRALNGPHERYADFLNGIILPQQEVSFELVGPTVEEIVSADFNKLPGDSATLALLLDDVVTATDAAGTPTRRSNFENYYRFALVPAKDSIIATRCQLKLSMSAYKQLQTATQGDANRWVKVPEFRSVYACL